jgi:AcrR family transcriptional regulator
MSKAEREATPTIGRGARRRQRTRAKLLSAAQAVMARKGADATTIQEITEKADVGFGSFYNHFESKQAIVEAMMAQTIETFGKALDRISEAVKDPAEVLAASLRYGVERAIDEPDLGWFLVHSGLSAHRMRMGLGMRMARDIRLGVESGRLHADDLEATLFAVGGMVLSIMAARLDGELESEAPERAATLALNLLGIPNPEAGEIAHRPLPPLTQGRRRGSAGSGRGRPGGPGRSPTTPAGGAARRGRTSP